MRQWNIPAEVQIMGNQSQNQGSGTAVDPVGTGAKNSHAAGSGSSTGDPGNPRGQQAQGGKTAKGGQPSRQATGGASEDSQNH
jgi:hypothetical protein